MRMIVAILLFLSASTFGQNIPAIDALIENELSSSDVPALAVVVIDSGKVVHLSTSGFKDLEQQLTADNNTSFHIASVSKVITNLAIFKLVEANKIDLSSDINQYLPFSVVNPHYPQDKITISELLNHRSGIRDNHKIYGPLWSTPMGDPKTDLEEFLREYLSKEGELYQTEHFGSGADYKSFSYSNTGVALLGLIVEQVTNLSFEEYCQNEIFEPLDMKHTSWFLRNLDTQQVAKTYSNSGDQGLIFKGHNGYPDYPAGQLRTSIKDFSQLLTGYLNSANSKFIISAKTTEQITPIPWKSHIGYYTWYLTAINDRLYYSHEGGDTGVRTIAMIDVRRKNGLAIFANSEHKLGSLLRAIESTMWKK